MTGGMIGKATLVRKLDAPWRCTWSLYRMEPPLLGCGHVIASAFTSLDSELTTEIWKADSSGIVDSFTPLVKPVRGLSHEDALRDAGYELVVPITQEAGA